MLFHGTMIKISSIPGPILFVVYGFFLLYKCVFGQTNKAEEEKEDINELKAKLKASPESEV